MYCINDLNHIINRACMVKNQERMKEKRGSVLRSSGSQEVSVRTEREVQMCSVHHDTVKVMAPCKVQAWSPNVCCWWTAAAEK